MSRVNQDIEKGHDSDLVDDEPWVDESRSHSRRRPARQARRSPRRRSSHGSRHRPLDFSRLLYFQSQFPQMKKPMYDLHTKKIRIRALLYMSLLNQKRLIAGEVEQMDRSGAAGPEQMERVRKLMKHYFQSLRDLKFTLEPPSENQRTADALRNWYYIDSENDSKVLQDAGLLPEHFRNTRPHLGVPSYTGHLGYSERKDYYRSEWQNFIARLGMALFGGLALIAPMLIMRLHSDLITQLVTTSVFVLVLGMVLAWRMKDAAPKDILGATAAYAAVLVVFVGTGSSN